MSNQLLKKKLSGHKSSSISISQEEILEKISKRHSFHKERDQIEEQIAEEQGF